ncbi:DNA recombination protein RmuC [Candidatus Falkowbacteria bacterium]|jgi:DNA recombination protein RmuC|nr:DNA recombination protein RmuC [Candidatus Falkowbacteria bacterium]MBT4432836.1 DNA recombination protein RmuC [Candidatus Falkowbacteria bacterium]
MNIFQIVIILIVLAGFGIILYFLNKKFSEATDKQKDDKGLILLQNQINEITKTLDTRLGESSRLMQNQFSESTKIITNITEKLTQLDSTSKQVLDLKTPLQNLEDILKNPKHRGILGEYQLELILKNVLPPSTYKMQYAFGDGDIVDAAVFVKDKIIPVDSKFSLENYNRIVSEKDPIQREKFEKEFKLDLKKRIDETAKYIKPEKGTMDFAFMFIPAEGIYYDLLVNQVGAVKVNTRDLIEYAFTDKHVIITSPTSFYAYLQMVVQGLNALQIEESAKEIRKRVEMLGRHINSYEDYFKKIGASLGTTVNHYNHAYKELKKVDKDVVKISGKTPSIEPLEVDRPKTE